MRGLATYGLVLVSLVLGLSAHDFHVSYGRMAIEGNTIAIRLRFFQNDLERSLRTFHGAEDITVSRDPESLARFRAYLDDKFLVTLGQDTLSSAVLGSGEEVLNKEPMWWYLVQYTASDTVRAVRVRNELLFETFDDQKNIVQVQHFPSEETGSLYFTSDRSTFYLEFE